MEPRRTIVTATLSFQVVHDKECSKQGAFDVAFKYTGAECYSQDEIDSFETLGTQFINTAYITSRTVDLSTLVLAREHAFLALRLDVHVISDAGFAYDAALFAASLAMERLRVPTWDDAEQDVTWSHLRALSLGGLPYIVSFANTSHGSLFEQREAAPSGFNDEAPAWSAEYNIVSTDIYPARDSLSITVELVPAPQLIRHQASSTHCLASSPVNCDVLSVLATTAGSILTVYRPGGCVLKPAEIGELVTKATSRASDLKSKITELAKADQARRQAEFERLVPLVGADAAIIRSGAWMTS